MIVGPGWAFVALVAAGIAAFVLVPSVGLLVVDEPHDGRMLLTAPPLVEVAAGVERYAGAAATVSPRRARRQVVRRILRVRNTGCDSVPTGAGFALDSKLLVAQGDVLPGAGVIELGRRNGKAAKLRTPRVYRLGNLSIAQVDGRLPRSAPFGRDASLGAAVAVVGYPVSVEPRVLPGVVIDDVPGTPFGVKGQVIRLTSRLGHEMPGGPVVDAAGRIVAVAFATDPRTGFAVAVPVATLESLVRRRALEALPPCDGA